MSTTIEAMNHANWYGTVEDCEQARQLGRGWLIEDEYIVDVEYALGTIFSELDHDRELHPEARGIIATELRERLERMPRGTENLRVETADNTITVRDLRGGVWWPNEDAHAEIQDSDDPPSRALQICEDEPTRGTWRQ